ncbi:Glu-tRNA(Gln) amidotransferase subunit GatE [Candidatus Pacearchaeota archaeon]|nr:Glu-tRNA(Gln) amidotransferase subunit GatE [Candidatus Pacearchaeota archaeon]
MSEEVKLKIGLEIHQQLDTHKLFCNCHSLLRNDTPLFEVKRKLHAVAGETGEIDKAALHESSLNKEFVYQGYDTTCLVELDEQPPLLINEEALEIALHVSLLLNCEIIPVSQIMRKTVIDGSNTSGFQRTVLIARNGFIDTEHGRVGIENISLEEDAARIIEEEPIKRIFRLDRLGIPLVEIGTKPDIKTAEQCKKIALFIGDVLRSCKVKRGIGTIRQDINISIANHPRVEIKGFQDVKMFIPVIEKEIERQKKNILQKKLVGDVRNALANGETEFLRPMPGASRMYPETDLPLLKISRDIINNAKKTLPKLRSEVKQELIKKGLIEDEVRVLLKQGMLEEFSALLKLMNEPRFIYRILIEIPKSIASRERKSIEEINEILTLDIIESIIDYVRQNKINKDNVKHVMEQIAKGKKFEDAIKIEKFDLTNVETEIAKLVKDKPGLTIGGYMGLIMNKFKGKISGKEASEILKKMLK